MDSAKVCCQCKLYLNLLPLWLLQAQNILPAEYVKCICVCVWGGIMGPCWACRTLYDSFQLTLSWKVNLCFCIWDCDGWGTSADCWDVLQASFPLFFMQSTWLLFMGANPLGSPHKGSFFCQGYPFCFSPFCCSSFSLNLAENRQ